ncbi:MAG: hypothetical protein LBT54_06150 [Bifidobacteriaceae bacterium]|jgi:endonuclease/exonuclease/phosphatase family metal-dependent hydrolase|nr:hypothetical protein [Bifidobacteriaceae bacterium]
MNKTSTSDLQQPSGWRGKVWARAFLWAAAFAMVAVGTIGPADAAQASNKSWSIASYNVGAFNYGNFIVTTNVGGSSAKTAAQLPNPIPNRWWGNNIGTANINRARTIAGWIATRTIDNEPLDIVATQEVSGGQVVVGTTTTTQRNDLNARLLASTSPIKYASVPVGTVSTYAVGTITCGTGSSTQTINRPMTRNTPIYYRTSALTVVASGEFSGSELLAAESTAARNAYRTALGTSFASCSSSENRLNNDKYFPFAILKTTGASANERNRVLIVSSIHSTASIGYKTATDADRRYFNGRIMYRLGMALRSMQTGGSGGGKSFVANPPAIVAGDFNDRYATASRSGSSVKSAPKSLVDDAGFTDSRPFIKTTTDCAGVVAKCREYATTSEAGSSKIFDYIMTRYTGNTTTRVKFHTYADDRRISDHRMISVRLKFHN